MKKIKVFVVALVLAAGAFLFTNEHVLKADASADAKI